MNIDGHRRRGSGDGGMTHRWHWCQKLGERKGDLCRVVATGSLNSALVEFGDGFRVVTSRRAVRRLRPDI